VTRPLLVFAAGSLRPVFDPVAGGPTASPGGPVSFRYANARDLAAAIERGELADVFASASALDPDRLHAQGRLTQPVAFARNRVVIGVPHGPRQGVPAVTDVADLAGPGLRIVIEMAGVPLGDYTREALRRLGRPDLAEAIFANVVRQEADVAAVVERLSEGSADAGFLYRTDVLAAADRLRSIELPGQAQVEATYLVGLVRGFDLEESAQAWQGWLLGPIGQARLAAAGFEPVKPVLASGPTGE
jgi:molybdate transport system substrate-binding protein